MNYQLLFGWVGCGKHSRTEMIFFLVMKISNVLLDTLFFMKYLFTQLTSSQQGRLRPLTDDPL